jgi:hypothetical protein
MKFCCHKFQAEVELPSTSAPNIRIIRFAPHPQLGDKPLLSFYVTMGYEHFSLYLPKLIISYCPFCGQDLKKWYKVDGFVNESEGETF